MVVSAEKTRDRGGKNTYTCCIDPDYAYIQAQRAEEKQLQPTFHMKQGASK